MKYAEEMRSLTLLLATALALAACEPPPYDTAGDAAAEPSIRILFPESSTDHVYCSTFTVVVDVDNFVLSPDFNNGNVDGEGHWHLMLGSELLAARAEEYAFLPEPFEDGDYSLTAKLVANDHQPLDPEVSWLTELTVDSTDEGCLGGGITEMSY